MLITLPKAPENGYQQSGLRRFNNSIYSQWLSPLFFIKRSQTKYPGKGPCQESISSIIGSEAYVHFYCANRFNNADEGASECPHELIAVNAEVNILTDCASSNWMNAIHATEFRTALTLGFNIIKVFVEDTRKLSKLIRHRITRLSPEHSEANYLQDNSVDYTLYSGMANYHNLPYPIRELQQLIKLLDEIFEIKTLCYSSKILACQDLTIGMFAGVVTSIPPSFKDTRILKQLHEIGGLNYSHVVGYIGEITNSQLHKTIYMLGF